FHSAWPLALFGSTSKSRRIATVFWRHDAGSPTWLDYAARFVRPNLMICPSMFAARASGWMFPGLRTEIVSCPVEIKLPGQGDESLPPKPKGSVVIIQVGRLDPIKGYLLHMRALSRLKHISEWRCWIVGGSQRPEEEAYYAELQKAVTTLEISNRVEFLGQR